MVLLLSDMAGLGVEDSGGCGERQLESLGSSVGAPDEEDGGLYEEDRLEDLVTSFSSSSGLLGSRESGLDCDDFADGDIEELQRFYYEHYGHEAVVLDHSDYRDCDADLETALSECIFEYDGSGGGEDGAVGCAVGDPDLGDGKGFQRTKSNRKLVLPAQLWEKFKSGNGNSKLDVRRSYFSFLKKVAAKRAASRAGGTKRHRKDNYYDAADEVGNYNSVPTPDSGVHDSHEALSPEERAKMEEQWKTELAKTEDEIATLRQVLSSRVKYSMELKRKLGITVWKEFRDDMEQGIKNVKESNAYQKTSETLKTVSERTTELLGNITINAKAKLGEVKNSNVFRSVEETVGNAYTNVRKVAGSRSTSMNFDEALREHDASLSAGATPTATTPSSDKPSA